MKPASFSKVMARPLARNGKAAIFSPIPEALASSKEQLADLHVEAAQKLLNRVRQMAVPPTAQELKADSEVQYRDFELFWASEEGGRLIDEAIEAGEPDEAAYVRWVEMERPA